MGHYLCEVRAGTVLDARESEVFRRVLGRHCPESRPKAYYLMSIHEQCDRRTAGEKRPKEVGWAKGIEGSRDRTGQAGEEAKRDGQHFDCAT